MVTADAQETITVDRLADPADVRLVLSEIWSEIKDDHCPDECPEEISMGDGIHVGIWDGELVGAYYFRPINSTLWEGHINVRPSAWGQCDEYTHAAIAWMRDNTACRKVIGFIPVTCDAVLRHVARCGFKSHAVLDGAIDRKGETVDVVMVEY